MRTNDVKWILAILPSLILVGCMGTRVVDLTTPKTEFTPKHIGDQVSGIAITVTCVDGTIREGEALGATDSTIEISHPESTASDQIPWASIHQMSLPGRPLLAVGGTLAAGIVGMFVGDWLESRRFDGDVSSLRGAKIGTVAGLATGAVVLGRILAERRYIIQPLNRGRDTLWVRESEILKETNTRITIQRDQGPVVYDRALVQYDEKGELRKMLVPAKPK